MDFTNFFNNFWETTGITLIKVFAILVFGILLIKIIMRYTRKAFMSSSMEVGLTSFLLSVIRVVLYILLLFIVLSTLGVSMAAFIAALSAAGLAIALALQDSLSNLASGILILVNKPFVEGDYIKVGTEEGTVRSVRIFTTQIETYDKKIITLPNKSIVNGNVINYTSSPLRRVDINFCVPFGTSQEYVKNTVLDAFKTAKYALKSPSIYINVDNFDEHGLLFSFRIWGKSEDYWDLYAEAYEKLTDALYNAGIQITNNISIVKLREDELKSKKSSTTKKSKNETSSKKNTTKKTSKSELTESNSNKAISYKEPIALSSSVIVTPSALISQDKATKKTTKRGHKNEK